MAGENNSTEANIYSDDLLKAALEKANIGLYEISALARATRALVERADESGDNPDLVSAFSVLTVISEKALAMASDADAAALGITATI